MNGAGERDAAPGRAEGGAGDLPRIVERVLDDLVTSARDALGADLRAVVLYGSGAEGRLRPVSDVNLIVVLSRFDRASVDRLRDPLRAGRAAARLRCMFVLESEIGAAAEAFAGKFADVLRRRRVLFGADPFVGLEIPRTAALRQLDQLLLNLVLRLRAAYLERSLREEQLALVVADAAGPLRSCATTLLELEGNPAPSPREAFARLVDSFAEPGWGRLAAAVSDARERRRLPAGDGGRVLFQLIETAQRMRDRARALR
jgi:predicted nucleotidyltransferase